MQERTAIAACPLQLRGSPAEFESQTWIDEQGLVMFHYMKRRTNKRLNSTSSCTWRRPSTAQRWPPPPPSRRPPPAHKEFQSPFHNCDIRSWTDSHHGLGENVWCAVLLLFGLVVPRYLMRSAICLGRPDHTVKFGKVCLWYDIGAPSFALVRTYDIVCSKFEQSKSHLMKKVHSALWENLVIWRSLAWAAGCQSLVNLQRDLHKKVKYVKTMLVHLESLISR